MGKGQGVDVSSERQFRSVQLDLDKGPYPSKSSLTFTVDGAVASLLRNPIDTIQFYYLAMWTILCLPAPIYFFAIRDSALSWSWWEYVAMTAHVVFVIHTSASFVAILHNHSHVPLFKKNIPGSQILNNVWQSWLLGPLFGQSPDTYYCHHIKMHHVTGNTPDDLSCTTWYERDNPLHFARYFFRFYFFCIIELPMWFAKRKQYTLAVRGIAGEVVFWTLAYFLGRIDAPASFLFFALPHTVMRVGMMSGNWAQHSFASGDDPSDDYTNSLTCINVRYNWIAFNDGYHTSHHLNALRHWSEHPKHLTTQMDAYAKNKTIVFEGIDFHGVFFALMAKNYNLLADRFVRLPGDNRSKEEIKAFLKARTRPIPASAYAKPATGKPITGSN